MERREFFKAAALSAVLSGTARADGAGASRPAVISSQNGLAATEKTMEMLRAGADTLDAVIAGVNIVEDDPSDMTVGYGGLPNENGVVQLDASVMHGPTRGAGAVAALENIKNPSNVAKLVMEHTDHVLLVGPGALEFARAMGFEEMDLLTDKSRAAWLEWKQELSDQDDWIRPDERLPKPKNKTARAAGKPILRSTGTINCNCVNELGDISGVTTTSGLAYKLAGRVGDSPIIGAGLFVDNEVGACGATGRGEANIKICGSALGVEFMRQGLSPEEAGLRVLERAAANTVEPYLLREDGKPNFHLLYYLINKKGEFAGVSMYAGRQYAAHDGKENKLRDCAYVYKS